MSESMEEAAETGKERLPSTESALQLREAVREAQETLVRLAEATDLDSLARRAKEFAEAEERYEAARMVVLQEAGVFQLPRTPRRQVVTTGG